MLMEVTHIISYCGTCGGINLIWDIGKEEWVAPYVEGGWYCDCADEALEARKGLTTED